MMPQQQKKSPLGPDTEPSTNAGVKRQVPASDTLLKELDTAVKEESHQQAQLEKRKRRILERCGCL